MGQQEAAELGQEGQEGQVGQEGGHVFQPLDAEDVNRFQLTFSFSAT